MKKTEEIKSEVVKLLDIVYGNVCEGTSHSWGRINNTMRAALHIAIGGGFVWDIGDWHYIRSHYRSGHWLGSEIEQWYSECVSATNKSAIDSYESMIGRQPFIADNVDPTECKLAHMTGSRAKERLAVGFKFMWKGQRVTVNSFAADGSYLNATEWRGYTGDAKPEKAPKRYKITREDIIADRKDRKERDKLFASLEEAVEKRRGTSTEILKELGITRRDERALVPIETLRAVAKNYEAKAA